MFVYVSTCFNMKVNSTFSQNHEIVKQYLKQTFVYTTKYTYVKMQMWCNWEGYEINKKIQIVYLFQLDIEINKKWSRTSQELN